MKRFGVRFRLFALGAAAALLGAAIALIILNFRRQEHELRARLNTIDAESGEIAAHFKDALRELNNTHLQYAIDRRPASGALFQKESEQLSQWLDRQAPLLRTPEEQEVFARLKLAYRDYLATAVAAAASAPARPADALAEFTRVRRESQHLFDLGAQLAQAHYASRNQLLGDARRRLRGLESSLLVLLSLLFGFGILLAAFAYRDLVAPLRLQLVETRGAAERNEKLASLGMLAAGVAHEIRNPLTAIKAALFIQQKRFPPGGPEHADSEVVQREITRLERIVSDFLQFARPAEPRLAALPVDELFHDVQALLAPGLAKSGIRLVVEGPAPGRIRADAGQIKQVLINLIQNAVDSIGRDGTITLRARPERKWAHGAERDLIVLEVADTGRGIPPDVGRRLFDPFFTTKETGTGLGLSIAARIVEKHHGLLQYQTQVDRGTIFGIALPHATA